MLANGIYITVGLRRTSSGNHFKNRNKGLVSHVKWNHFSSLLTTSYKQNILCKFLISVNLFYIKSNETCRARGSINYI